MQRHQGHSDGRAIGFAVNVPTPDPERPPHPLEIGDGDPGAEILEIEAVCDRLGTARGIDSATLGQCSVIRVRGDGNAGIEERPAEVRAKLRFRPAGSPLIDEDEIAACGVGDPGLVIRVDGEGTAWAAVDINHGVRERRLLSAFDNDDRQLESACS